MTNSDNKDDNATDETSSNPIDETSLSPTDETSSKPSDETSTSEVPSTASEKETAGRKLEPTDEVGGRDGPDPTRYGDWENKGILSDF